MMTVDQDLTCTLVCCNEGQGAHQVLGHAILSSVMSALQGDQAQSRRASLDSTVSFAQSEQLQPLERAGSKRPGASGKHSHSSRRTLGGGSSKTRSK